MGGVGSGRHRKLPKPRTLLNSIVPIGEIFDDNEMGLYKSLVEVYLNDFDDELTAGDQDDIMTIAVNKILEIRLLKISHKETHGQLEVSTALEKLRKQTDKAKESLSSRRRDRIDPNKFKGLSIVDLAVAFDEDKKAELEEKVRSMKLEQSVSKEKLKTYKGNRYDLDDTNKDEQLSRG